MGNTAYLLLTAIVLLVLSCGGDPAPGEPGAVITVNGSSVLADEVAETFERYRGDSIAVDVLRDNILARELFLAHARDLGLHEDREVQRLVHERRREILQSAWLSHELDQVPSDTEAVRSFWENLGTGVSYTALSLRDTLLMDSIADLVASGADLSRLASIHGIDNITRTTGGRIDIPDRLYANIMDLDHLSEPVEGSVIGPFPVPVGQRILRIDSVWTYQPGPFQEDSQSIARMLLSREREIRKQFVEDSLKTALQVTVSMEAMELMASRGNGAGFEPFTEEEQELPAVEWNGGSRDIYSVSRNILGLPAYLPRSTADPLWLAEYADRLALFDIEMEMALSLGLDTVEATARQLRVKELETLLDAYYENIIQPRIQPDSVFLAQIYDELRETMPVPEKRVFNVLFLQNSAAVAEAGSVMDSGGDMMTMTDRFETFPPILAEGETYLTVPMTEMMIPEGDRDTLFGLEQGGEAIISLTDTTSLWFRLVSVEPQRSPEFSEIRDRVVAEAEERLEIEIIGGLVDSLEAVYHPYVDNEFFQEFYVPSEQADTTAVSGGSEEVTDAL
ncbi:MAG TPA: hypothetical protein PLM22_06225 [Candidatus Sabulitectum sp.]|nr:hypothetical protein [Candidatus Sabulitectum sp.]HPJ28512.1 hypothetical protein [Candidatus Sabulitectum sp.]HPR22252.1 hypothetical protein [Candidatus Sabulitectum sp.]